jgi:hypothetical protein
VQGKYKLAVPAGLLEHNWRGIWMTPALLATGVLVVFLVFFREPKRVHIPTSEVEGAAVGLEGVLPEPTKV